jgi:predicted amidophosphoribosyltransferase
MKSTFIRKTNLNQNYSYRSRVLEGKPLKTNIFQNFNKNVQDEVNIHSKNKIQSELLIPHKSSRRERGYNHWKLIFIKNSTKIFKTNLSNQIRIYHATNKTMNDIYNKMFLFHVVTLCIFL